MSLLANLEKYLRIVKAQECPFRFLLSRVLRYTGTWRVFYIKRRGYILKLHPASLALSLWVNPDERELDSYVISSLLERGDVYVDVGANIGHLVIEGALAVGREGKVFAFEAHPRTAQYLRENVSINGLTNVFIAQVAVGSQFGWVRFSDIKSDDQNRVIADEKGIYVPQVCLEPFVIGEKIKLLKIDVEGFEKFVIEGLGHSIDNVEHIYFEVMDSHYKEFDYEFTEIFDLLSSAGFTIASFKNNGLEVVSRDRSFPICENLLASRDLNKVRKMLGFSV